MLTGLSAPDQGSDHDPRHDEGERSSEVDFRARHGASLSIPPRLMALVTQPTATPLRRLHGPHSTWRFSGSLLPPRDTGMM